MAPCAKSAAELGVKPQSLCARKRHAIAPRCSLHAQTRGIPTTNTTRPGQTCYSGTTGNVSFAELCKSIAPTMRKFRRRSCTSRSSLWVVLCQLYETAVPSCRVGRQERTGPRICKYQGGQPCMNSNVFYLFTITAIIIVIISSVSLGLVL